MNRENSIRSERIKWTVIWVAVTFIVVLLRLFYIQVVKHDMIQKQADKQHTKRIETKGKRGRIIASSGEDVAYDVEKYDLIADPVGIGEKNKFIIAEASAKIIAASKEYAGVPNINQLIEAKRKEILANIEKGISKKSRYYLVCKDLTIEQKKKMEELLFDENERRKKKPNKKKKNQEKQVLEKKINVSMFGINFDVKYERVYPQEKKYENLAGYVNIDSEGAFGIEKKFNDYLRGKEGYVKRQVSTGKIFELPVGEGNEIVEAKNGDNIVLTIDNYMQHVLSNELEKMFTDTEAEWASAIIIECGTGKIKAMVSMPIDENKGFIRNNTFQNQYEPGSIMKPVVMAEALEDNLIREDEKFKSTGTIKVFDRVIHEHDDTSTGTLSLTDIISKSSNIAMVLISQRFTREQFYNAMVKFGFDEKTGIDIFGEKKVHLRHYKKWDGITMATMSYGHGIVVTQLQMAYALNAVMNGGILYKPLIVEKICDTDGKLVKQFEPEAKRRVISQEVSAKLRKMLKDTVERGTGIPAAIPGYDIGGKTGTAKYSGGKGYEPGKYVSSFVGIYPTKQPKYLALITIAKPKGKIYGGQVGAPVFRETFKKIFLYKNIRPESETEEFVYLGGVENRKIETKEEKTEKNNKTVKESNVKEGTTVEERKVMPNLKGLRIAEAINILDKFNIDIETTGRGVVVDQNPKPGKDMKDVKTVEIKLEEKNSGK